MNGTDTELKPLSVAELMEIVKLKEDKYFRRMWADSTSTKTDIMKAFNVDLRLVKEACNELNSEMRYHFLEQYYGDDNIV